MPNKIKYFPLLFFLFIFLVLSFPYLFQQKVPFPTSYIANNIGPWNGYFPPGPVKNGIPDVPGEIYPLKSTVIDSYQKRFFPLWNPYSFSGSPLLANFQSAAFSPLNILFLILPKIHAESLIILLQPILAGIFVYLLGRLLKMSLYGSLLSAVSFMFCGFLTVWGSYATMGYTILFLPIIMFFIEKYLVTNKIIYLPFVTIFLGVSFFSGHIQTWVYVFLATTIYAFVNVLIKSKNSKIKILAITFLFILLAIPLVLIQLLPSLEFYQLSGRQLSKNNTANIGISLAYLITLISPDFFGNPVTRNDWFGTYAEWSGYIGLIPLIFAIFSIFQKNNKNRIVFLIIAFIGFLLSVKNPILGAISKLPLPIISNSNPGRAIVLLSFSLSLLAGFGLDGLIQGSEKDKNKLKKILIFFAIIFALLFAICLTPYKIFGLDIANNLRIISLRNIILPMVIFILLVLSIIIFAKSNKLSRYLPILIVFLALFEMTRFYLKWTPFDLKNYFYGATAIGNFMQNKKEPYRFYGLGQTPAYILGLYTYEGYEPLNLLSYSQFIYSVKTGKKKDEYHLSVSLETREKNTKKILDLLGVKYLIYSLSGINSPFAFPIGEYNYKKIFADNKFVIFDNTDAVSKTRLYNNFIVEKDRDKILSLMFSDNFDLKKTIILEKWPGTSKLSLGRASVVKYQPNEVVIKTAAPSSALVFLNDNFYPGWQAYINGQKTEVLRADFTFRAVLVPKGENIVIFRYEPISFKIGMYASFTALGILLLIILKNMNMKNKK